MERKTVILNLGGQSLRESLATFFDWWMTELAALLPPRVRQFMQRTENRLILELEGEQVLVTECRGGNGKELRRYDLEPDGRAPSPALVALLGELEKESTEVVVRLSARQSLSKTLALPIEAEENLREVLGYEMERHTPFKLDQVYYDYEVIDRQADVRRLRVKLTVIPRPALDQVMHTVVQCGLQPAVVTIAEAAGPGADVCASPAINLLPESQRPSRAGSWNLLNRGLAVSAVVLLIVMSAVPLLRHRTAISDLETRVAAIKKEADAVGSLEDRIDQLVSESRFVVDKKQQSPVVIDVLHELTLVLPDNTWLQRFEVKGAKLDIRGESSAASALIGLIEASKVFRNATFSSPVVRDPRSNSERFQIVAEVVPGGRAL